MTDHSEIVKSLEEVPRGERTPAAAAAAAAAVVVVDRKVGSSCP